MAVVAGIGLIAWSVVGSSDGTGTSGSSGSSASSTTAPSGSGGWPVSTTAPLAEAGAIGEGWGPAVRGRTPLRGFAEVRATITGSDGTVCDVCLLAATSRAQQERGLMEVRDPTLGGYDGMVFLYDPAVEGAFWMRNTPLPLSIAWFDAGGGLLARTDMAPCGDTTDCPSYPAGSPFAYALEVPKGRLADVGVRGRARIALRTGPCPLAR